MPDSVFSPNLSMENALGTESCIAVELEIELDGYDDKKIVLMIGEEEDKNSCINIINKYKNLEKACEELSRSKKLLEQYFKKSASKNL